MSLLTLLRLDVIPDVYEQVCKKLGVNFRADDAMDDHPRLTAVLFRSDRLRSLLLVVETLCSNGCLSLVKPGQ